MFRQGRGTGMWLRWSGGEFEFEWGVRLGGSDQVLAGGKGGERKVDGWMNVISGVYGGKGFIVWVLKF